MVSLGIILNTINFAMCSSFYECMHNSKLKVEFSKMRKAALTIKKVFYGISNF